MADLIDRTLVDVSSWSALLLGHLRYLRTLVLYIAPPIRAPQVRVC